MVEKSFRLAEQTKSKNILITGANGYIGSHIVSRLLRTQNNIVAVDFSNSNIDKNACFIKYDILKNADNANLYYDLGPPDIILHLAWRDGFEHNAESHLRDLSSHYLFIKNMIDNGCKHIAVAGSFREYGPCKGMVSENHHCVCDNNYSLAKQTLYRAIKLYIENQSVCFQWLRFFTPYGDDELNNSILSKILRWEHEGRLTFPFTDGTESYDYIHIDELSKQVVAAIHQTDIDDCINICTGKPTSLKEIVETFIKEKKLKIKPEYGAFKSRSYDSTIIYGDNLKIQKILENYNEK